MELILKEVPMKELKDGNIIVVDEKTVYIIRNEGVRELVQRTFWKGYEYIRAFVPCGEDFFSKKLPHIEDKKYQVIKRQT